jgi:hypothetical protein
MDGLLADGVLMDVLLAVEVLTRDVPMVDALMGAMRSPIQSCARSSASRSSARVYIASDPSASRGHADSGRSQ